VAAQKTAQDVMDGEDSIVSSMKRFANDAKCVEYLRDFKGEAESKIAAYRGALVQKMKDDISERAAKQLQAIASFESAMGSAMQELVVREAASSFREKFPTDEVMQREAFAAAVKSLAGEGVSASEDPVAKHFNDSFATLQGADLMSVEGNPTGTLAERVAFAQQAKEMEFQQSFMVTAAEAGEVKKIASEAMSGTDYDFSKLPAASSERLDALYTSINAKVGYSLPESLGTKPITATSDAATHSYVDQVNAQLEAATAQLREARLKAFVQAFA